VTELTGKQRSVLKSQAQRLEPVVHVGKAGLSEAFMRQVASLLEARELIKVRLPAGSGADRRSTAAQIAQAVAAALVGVVGRNAILYRPNEKP